MSARLLMLLGAGLLLVVVGAPVGHTSARASPPLVDGGGAGRFVWPVTTFVMTQGFGCTDIALEPRDPTCPGGHFHSGLDLAASSATPVRAAGSGLVVLAAADAGGYGTHVVIDHGDGVSTLYGHLSEMTVHAGQLVLEGEPVGRVGSTGNSTGPHLHFEVRAQGHPVDPEPRLPARTLRGVFQ